MKVGRVMLYVVSVLVAGISGVQADTINVADSMSFTEVNAVIAGSSPGDTINWTAGMYQQDASQAYYIFLGDRNYTFEDGTTIRGFETASGFIFKTNGSNINITGNGTVIFGHCSIIAQFGDFDDGGGAYTNIHVSGITSEPSVMHYEWENLKHATDRTAPDIWFDHMTLIGGSTGFQVQTFSEEVDGTSPYISVDHITADGLGSILVSMAVRDDTAELPDGQDYITNIALLNSNAVIEPVLYPLFRTPEDLAQQDVTNPYINETTNCFETDDMMFQPGSYVPVPGSPLDLGGGEYIGAYAPMDLSAVPEPGGMALLALGAAGLIRRRRE